MKTFLLAALLFGANVPCDQTGWTKDEPTPDIPGISLNDKFEDGEKIVAEFHGEPALAYSHQTSVYWRCASDKVQFEINGSKAYIWAPPGKYDVTVTVKSSIDVFVPDPADPTNPAKAKPASIPMPDQVYSHAFQVGAIVPPPSPKPLDGLAALVADPAHRKLLAEFFTDLAGVVRQGAFDTTTHFRNAYRDAITKAKTDGTLPGGGVLTPIDKPISDRIAGAISLLPDVPMDAAKNEALAAVFDAVAADFGR